LLAIVVMAAGKGTRMNSDLPKVLHTLGGRPLVEHVLSSAREIEPNRLIVITGHRRNEVQERVTGDGVEFVVQEPQLGTGHAVRQTQPALRNFAGEIIVLSGDVPLLKASTLRKLLDLHRQRAAVATVLSTDAPNPNGYGRIVRTQSGTFVKIVEEREASDVEKQICEINSGIYCFDAEALFDALQSVKPDNSKGEYYLTDVIEILKKRGEIVEAVDIADFREVRGINTLEELLDAERALQADVPAKKY
jgi:UDP-N-acetylglucosamine diphosphorylase/glucosamine-1-phosphate N-acetyltransferase